MGCKAEFWHRIHQSAQIGMLWIAENIFAAPAFHHFAAIHHNNFIGHIRNNAEIMRDQQNGHSGFGLDFFDQGEDLRLRRHVECGCRLISDQQCGATDKRHRNHRALAHAA